MNLPKLFVGPMSKEIVDIVIDYSKNTSLGLIPSRRQVEFNGGYVNNWTTEAFSSYVRNRSKNVILFRDHGGPGQGSEQDDGMDSLNCDIENNFDFLHIDPWKQCVSFDDGIDQTINLIKKCYQKNKNIYYEVGTEESIFPYTHDQLNHLLNRLKSELSDEMFNQIKIAVIQSGVKISGTKNIGNFNPTRLEKMINVVRKFNISTKEHNGDYLTREQIKRRFDIGLDCINIAPEFGVTQTNLLIENTDINFENAYSTCLSEGKYKKWIPEDVKEPTKLMIVQVSGHYCFTKYPFEKYHDHIKGRLKKLLFERFDSITST